MSVSATAAPNGDDGARLGEFGATVADTLAGCALDSSAERYAKLRAVLETRFNL